MKVVMHKVLKYLLLFTFSVQRCVSPNTREKLPNFIYVKLCMFKKLSKL